MSISGLDGRIPISGCRSLTQSFGGTFIELVMVENSRITVEFRRYLFQRYIISGLVGHIAISGYRPLSQSFGGTSFKFVMVENQNCHWNFDAIYHSSREITYFRFGRPYCYLRLSVVFAITFFELAMVENPRVQLETNKFVVLLLKFVVFFTRKRNTCA